MVRVAPFFWLTVYIGLTYAANSAEYWVSTGKRMKGPGGPIVIWGSAAKPLTDSANRSLNGVQRRSPQKQSGFVYLIDSQRWLQFCTYLLWIFPNKTVMRHDGTWKLGDRAKTIRHDTTFTTWYKCGDWAKTTMGPTHEKRYVSIDSLETRQVSWE